MSNLMIFSMPKSNDLLNFFAFRELLQPSLARFPLLVDDAASIRQL